MNIKVLNERQQRIINLLRAKSYGFNELCNELNGYTCRLTLKKDLDRLFEMGLIRVKKGRRGQKNVYSLTEHLEEFERRVIQLESSWKELVEQIEIIDELLSADQIEPYKAGRLLTFFIYKACFVLTPLLSFNVKFPSEANKKLFNFSSKLFHDFVCKVVNWVIDFHKFWMAS